MPAQRPTKKRHNRRRTASALTRGQYRLECLRRHPDFRRDWESLMWTTACMSADLQARRDARDPRAPQLAAALAETTEILQAGLAKKWPGLFDQRGITLRLSPNLTEEEWLAPFRKNKERHDILPALRNVTGKTGPTKSHKRTHKGELDFRLKVFDSYRELRNFTMVAQRLHAAESNVRRAYRKVYLDIFATDLPKRIKERRTADFDVASHTDSCPICPKANTFKEMCAAARAHAEKD